MKRGATRGTLLAVALGCSGLPTPARAAPPGQAEYLEGKDAFDGGAFLDGAKAWENALAQLPEEPEHARARARLILDISTAYEKAGDETSLQRARRYLVDYAPALELAYAVQPQRRAEERARRRDRMARIDAKLRPRAQAPPPAPAAAPEGATAPEVLDTPEIRVRKQRPGLAVAGGSVLLVAGFGAGLALLFNGLDKDDEVQQIVGTTVMAVGGTVGAVFLVSGARKLVMRAKRSKPQDETRARIQFTGAGVGGAF